MPTSKKNEFVETTFEVALSRDAFATQERTPEDDEQEIPREYRYQDWFALTEADIKAFAVHLTSHSLSREGAIELVAKHHGVKKANNPIGSYKIREVTRTVTTEFTDDDMGNTSRLQVESNETTVFFVSYRDREDWMEFYKKPSDIWRAEYQARKEAWDEADHQAATEAASSQTQEEAREQPKAGFFASIFSR